MNIIETTRRFDETRRPVRLEDVYDTGNDSVWHDRLAEVTPADEQLGVH